MLNKQTIPREEKARSIFEPHARWISKGKAGVSQELGVSVAVVEDQNRFVLNHCIIQDGSDADHAQSLMAQAQPRFAEFVACGLDCCFQSPDNQLKLAEMPDNHENPADGGIAAGTVRDVAARWPLSV